MRNRGLNKVIAVLMTTVILCGCGSQATGEPTTESESQVEETVVEKTQESTETEAGEETEESEVAQTGFSVPVAGIKPRSDEMRDITPTELVSEMTVGWNLGNTLDSEGTSGLAAETSWDNPKTTKEMIDTVCERGFNSIRIPVTFANHMGPAPDYKVEEEWMDRVEEVVNYALDDGMYVVLDSHHEESWRILDNEHIDAVDEEVRVLWTQIAERFKDYGDHLIFEGLNEPRVRDGMNEWNGGTEEGRACLDRLNQTFVDAVRATGGNNEKRLLLITSFASSHVLITIENLKIPEDDHLAVSIHAYTPYFFTYDGSGGGFYDQWNGRGKADINNVMNDLKRVFLDKGIPVLLTEMGAQDKNGNSADVSEWVVDYMSKAKEYGMPCFWWDNGYYDRGNEHFSIFNRYDLTWYREDVVNAIMSVYYPQA